MARLGGRAYSNASTVALEPFMKPLNNHVKAIYEQVVGVVFGIILLFIILGVVMGTLQMISTVWHLLEFKSIATNYTELITGVLTVYVLLELSRSLVEYHETSEIRISFLIDAAIIFVVREIMIELFEHNVQASLIYAFSVFLVALGFIRLVFLYISKNSTPH